MDMPLQVAFVTETYPPEVNGVATTTAQLVEGLRRRGHQVQLFRPRQRGADIAHGAAQPAAPGLLETLLPSLAIPRYPGLRMGLPAGGTLARRWAAARPDVVHIATEGPLGWSALQAARRLGIAVTSDFRTNFHAYSGHYGIGWLRRPIAGYLRRFHNACCCTMVPGDALAAELAALGFRNLRVVRRGVDTEQFSPAQRSAALRARWGVGAGELAIGTVGRLASEKNLRLVVQAWRSVRQVQPAARLVLVGDGPMAAELRQLCPDAVFAGVQRGDALAAHHASLDVFLFASVTETFGNVTPEAMASGVPVVAFDHAAAGQLIDSGHSGLLSAVGDAAGFVANAVSLAALSRAAERQRLGANGRAAVLQLGWGSVIDAFETQLRSAQAALAAATADAARGRGGLLAS